MTFVNEVANQPAGVLTKLVHDIQVIREGLNRLEDDTTAELRERGAWPKTCYDCAFCQYDEYGQKGYCTEEVPNPPIFEDLGATYHEWEEPAGSFPRMSDRCEKFQFGERQFLARRVHDAKMTYHALLRNLRDRPPMAREGHGSRDME